MIFKKISFFVIALFFILPVFQSCVEQVDAEFDLQPDIIFIDAYALTEPGVSTVTISKSIFDAQNNYRVVNEHNAKVKIENLTNGEIIEFPEDDNGIYLCPPTFAASVGEVWKLFIELENGKKIESKPQTITTSIPLDNIQATYSPEIEFNLDYGRFVPGHRVSIDWQDPAGEENYYLWKYRIFEPLFVCKTCLRGIFRNGECVPTGLSYGPPYYNYTCLPDCWQISFGNELTIFNDRLEDGATITDREIAVLPFYRRPSILIEVQQLSLDKSAFEYFEVINSQISQSGGLNAPPPAALLGNLFNPDDSSDLILGQFTAAGISTKRLFIDRSQIEESPFAPTETIILENCPTCPTSYPCEESATRTAIKPEGWP